MEIEDTDFTQDGSQRVKINQKHCVVCGAPSSTCKGKLFYQTGMTRFGAPFCKEHLAKFDQYAQPIFENKTAQDLFRYMHSRAYRKKIEGKLIIYFDTYKRAGNSGKNQPKET